MELNSGLCDSKASGPRALSSKTTFSGVCFVVGERSQGVSGMLPPPTESLGLHRQGQSSLPQEVPGKGHRLVSCSPCWVVGERKLSLPGTAGMGKQNLLGPTCLLFHCLALEGA